MLILLNDIRFKSLKSRVASELVFREALANLKAAF